MGIFEKESDATQNRAYREHLNHNWDAGNDAFDMMTKRLAKNGEQSADEVVLARVDIHGKDFNSLGGRIDDAQGTAEAAYDVAKNELGRRLSEMDNGVHAYASANEIKEKYPNGADGIFVAIDTGHQWYYNNNAWVDAGSYQAVGSLGFKKTIVWNSKSSNTNANDLSAGSYYIAIQSSNKENAKYFHDILNLPYFLNQSIALGCLKVVLTDDSTGGYQTIESSIGSWTRSKSAGTWTDWFEASESYKQTIVWNSKSSNTNANDLSAGSYYVAIDGTNSETAKYLNSNLNLPLVNGVEKGTLFVNISKPTENFGGTQLLVTDKNIYVRSASNSVWTDWLKIKDANSVPEFKKTIVLNSVDGTENANNLSAGVYFVALDPSSTAESEYFYSTLNWPLLSSLEVGVMYSQINANGDGTQFFVTNQNIYVRSKASVINSGNWTDWQSMSTDSDRSSTSNKTVFLGDSRMAGLLGNGKGYASPRPYEIVAKNNGLIHSGHAVSGTGYLYTVDGTNAQTTADSLDFSKYDNAIFAYGINDYLKNETLGTVNDTVDSESVVGGFLKTLNKVFSDNPTCNTVVVLPFNASNRGNENSRYALETKNDAQTPYTLEEMQSVLADVCEKYNIPYVDTRKGCSINLLNLTSVLGDGLHPTTQKEYELYAKWLSAEIGSKLQPIFN